MPIDSSVNSNMHCQRAFRVCAPTVWNSLPLSIRLAPTLATFKRNLKTIYVAPSSVSNDFPGLRFGYRFVI